MGEDFSCGLVFGLFNLEVRMGDSPLLADPSAKHRILHGQQPAGTRKVN